MGGQRPLEGDSRGPLRPVGVAGVTCAKRAQQAPRRQCRRWAQAEREFLMSQYRRMPLRAVAKRLGRSYGAVRMELCRLKAQGVEWPEDVRERVCCTPGCGRVVWEESARARRMHLCHGCFNEEMRLRALEAGEDNRRRQREFKARRGKRRKK